MTCKSAQLKFVCSKDTFARSNVSHSHHTPAWCYGRNTSQTSANHGRFSLSSDHTVALRGLRLAELQKGALVHVAGTESFDVVGGSSCSGKLQVKVHVLKIQDQRVKFY